ncbi:hypothetical protein JHK85_010338 [Glycine max]|nr:hypothetical protein JHK85_010338 [Glycine max]
MLTDLTHQTQQQPLLLLVLLHPLCLPSHSLLHLHLLHPLPLTLQNLVPHPSPPPSPFATTTPMTAPSRSKHTPTKPPSKSLTAKVFSSYSYRHLAKSLVTKGLHITSVDLPGHGFSDNSIEVSGAFSIWVLEVPVVREVVLGVSFVFAKVLGLCCSKTVGVADSERSRTLLSST